MEKKRFIFDLDNTLLKFDKDYQERFFQEEFGENNPLSENLQEYLETYWVSYPRFSDTRFASVLSLCSGLRIKESFIDRWIDTLKEMPPVLEDGVGETLDYLKGKDKSLVVLTNWVWESQIPRLKKAGIYHYFDKIYTGNYVLKPHRDAYETSMRPYFSDECIFIGDDLENDYIGPRELGYDAILYDKNDKHPKQLVKIKRINELKEKY